MTRLLFKKIVSGPNIEYIMIYYKKEKEIDMYNDPFLAPEILLREDETAKVDSWIFGQLLYCLLFGEVGKPIKETLEKWRADYNIKDMSHIPKDQFLYYPFENAFGKNESSNKTKIFSQIINSIKKVSFSGMTPKELLKSEELSSDLNGIGMILDLISCCLQVDPDRRPNLISLSGSELFQFDNYELILINKFVYNTLKYYSPQHMVIKSMLLPLREISSEVIKCPAKITFYDDFLVSIIDKLSTYFFRPEFSGDVYESDEIFVNTKSDERLNLNKKNSEIVRTVFLHKIIDILIFLALRNYNYLKKQYEENKQDAMPKFEDKKTQAKLQRKHISEKKKKKDEYCNRVLSRLIQFFYECLKCFSNYENVSF